MPVYNDDRTYYSTSSKEPSKELRRIKKMLERSRIAYTASIREALTVLDLYENDQYTDEQLAILRELDIPAMTLNQIKYYTDVLTGYLCTIANDIQVTATHPEHVVQATVLSDVIQYILKRNRFEEASFEVKNDYILFGYCAVQHFVGETGAVDENGRPLREIKVEYVPALELQLDPASKRLDYSDASFIHRTRWVTRQDAIKMFPSKKEKIMKIRAGYSNNTGQYEQITNKWQSQVDDPYGEKICITHTCYEDEKRRRWSVYWSGNITLYRKEITGLKTRFPYVIQKAKFHADPKFYGVFHELIETQRSINIFVIQLFQLAMSDKIYVNSNSVDEDQSKFEEDVQSPGSIVFMRDINGIKRETHSQSIQYILELINQYKLYFKEQLHINDSLLGQAFSADSGRKVQLQQNAGAMSLRYLEIKMSSFYVSLGKHIASLITQYYTANQIIPITDEVTGTRYLELNKPLAIPTGEFIEDPMTGGIRPVTEPRMQVEIDPENGKPVVDENGFYHYVPIPTFETDISVLDYQIDVVSTPYNNEDEIDQQITENIIGGLPGQLMSQLFPQALIESVALLLRNKKTRTASQIYEILKNASGLIQQEHNNATMLAQRQQELNMAEQVMNMQRGENTGTPAAVPQSQSLGQFNANNTLASKKAESTKLGKDGKGR